MDDIHNFVKWNKSLKVVEPDLSNVQKGCSFGWNIYHTLSVMKSSLTAVPIFFFSRANEEIGGRRSHSHTRMDDDISHTEPSDRLLIVLGYKRPFYY